MRVYCTIIGLLGSLCLTHACGNGVLAPDGQVLIFLDTNAPVRAASSARDPIPLFDRILVEIYPPGAAAPCHECRRELAVDAEKMRRREHSFGFVPPPRVVGYRVRLVLFRSAGGLPARRESAIELVGYLPAVAEEGISEITATFRVEDVGTARGTLEAPIVFDKGPPAASAEGAWRGAVVTPCATKAPEGAVCVPGGAFFMGDSRITLAEGRGGRRERIAVLPAFYLDAHEATVGELRASNLAEVDSRGLAKDPVDDSSTAFGVCDYTSKAGANEALPVVCISAALARRYCQSRGGDLPTEAEIEMVASLRGTTLLPWGSRDPTCKEALIGGCSRNPDPLAIDPRQLPGRPGSGSLDRVVLEGGTIVDLAANVSEWTRDAFQPDEGRCWASSLLFDPRCDDDAATARSVKGGSIDRIPVDFAQLRRGVGVLTRPADVGFRCAYRLAPLR